MMSLWHVAGVVASLIFLFLSENEVIFPCSHASIIGSILRLVFYSSDDKTILPENLNK